MSDPNSTEQPDSTDQLEQHLSNEIGRLRDLAVKSTDPLVVAKAIAVSDEGVQQLVLGRLRARERLVEVFALQGTTTHELQVLCRFIPANEIVHLVNSGVLAIVDYIKRRGDRYDRSLRIAARTPRRSPLR